MLKRIISVILIVSVVLLAAGCGGSSPKSVEDAKKYFEKDEWEVTSETESGLGIEGVVNGIAANKGVLLNAGYIELKTSELAREGFKGGLTELGEMVKKTKDTKSYARYEADLMGMKIVMIRKGKYILTAGGEADEIEKVIKALGMK